jgi:hypothetical protein
VVLLLVSGCQRVTLGHGGIALLQRRQQQRP